jgi:DNA-binding GntR family transcriptional regulator
MVDTKEKSMAGALTKSQQAYNILREMIVSKEFSSGNSWSLRKLAQRLDMSVVPITEALRRLEQEGILEVKPQRGITVRQLSAREAEDLMVIREGFEVQAARLLAMYGPREKFKKLMLMAQKLQKTLKEGKYAQAAVIDLHLHQEMVASANLPLLTERYNQLVSLSMIDTGDLDSTWLHMEMSGRSSHVHLVDMIASGDPEKADLAIREHIRTGADRKKSASEELS